ncbi:MAG: hypothetical protein HZB26_07625 [Candidatus Hydrogenedentes bacterium]|nr:hypothetical protein [Candidatus Hydrogenedentota bacterium]
MKIYAGIAACLFLCSCSSDVTDKVMVDFGLKEKPEGYQSQSDAILTQLRAVGQGEMKRMNGAGRRGEIRFQDAGGMQGTYYKEVKVYESFQGVDAQSYSTATAGERGYYGYVDYTYRLYQSERTPNKAEAESKTADIRTDKTGHETYRYKFGSGGTWDGHEGELAHR